MTTPDIGIHQGVKFKDYQQWQAINPSTLVDGLCSMRRMRAKLDNKLPDKDSDAKRLGRAIHSRLLEPDSFVFDFPVVDRCSALTGKDGQNRCRNSGRFMNNDGWWCGVHQPAECSEPLDFVTEVELARVEKIREAALLDPTLGKLHRYKGSEACVVVELCGVLCKCRLDKLIQANGKCKIVDLKTTGAGNLSTGDPEDWFGRERIKLNYHVKLAMYADAVEKVTGIRPEASWGVLETDEPYEVMVTQLPDDERDLGRTIYQEALDKVRECQESGKWPGRYESGPGFSVLPQWYWNKFKFVALSKEIR